MMRICMRRCGGLLLMMGMFIGVVSLGCSKKRPDETAQERPSPKPIGHAECAACGMVVSEQPAPRMQVVHRDGKRAYFCSIGDALHYLADGSAHGSPSAIYVEALPGNVDPRIRDTTEKDWVLASEASFVMGVEREGVMGKPVLAFRSIDEGKALAAREKGTVAAWSEVMSTGGARE